MAGPRSRGVRRLLLAIVLVGTLTATGSVEAREQGGSPVALVTAERQNLLLAVSLPDGKVLRRVRLATDPEFVASLASGPAIVVSGRGRAVTVLAWRTLKVLRVLHGFVSPHLVAISPDGEWAYVSDDGSGQLVVIELANDRIVARLFVGLGAHHLSFSRDQTRLWVALGERANTLAIVDTSRPNHPRLLRRLNTTFDVHDLAFSPDGDKVWLTSDTSSQVTVVDAHTTRVRFRVPAGPPPQHVAFNYDVTSLHNRVWLTSGYGNSIEVVNANTGHVLRTRTIATGSFELATGGSLVITSSLLNGTITELNDNLRPLSRSQPTNVARDIELSVW